MTMIKRALTLGVVMDPIASIKVTKDSTLAMLLEAQARGWALLYMEQGDLSLQSGQARGRARPLRVQDDPRCCFELAGARELPLGDLDVILMRKDPPFDMEYIYTTYLLELAQRQGARVFNDPAALRAANEKVFATHFPQCMPPTLITRRAEEIRRFLNEQEDVVLKPLDGFGGQSVFRIRPGDHNTGVVIETLTQNGQRTVMAQRFIPEIARGDKRILVIDGEPVPHALARIPAPGEMRGNLAAGGRGVGIGLSERDLWICEQVGPTLREMGLLFVGLDVIGDYLTEVNVTSPTCIRELDRIFSVNIAARILDRIEAHLCRSLPDPNLAASEELM